MSNLWVTFSTDISGTFTELSGNIIYNLNNLYNFNGNLVDTTSNFIIYELSNNPIQGGVPLQTSNWNQFNSNTNLSPFQGYWLGGINTNLPQIFTSNTELQTEVNNWTNNPIPVVNIYGLIENWNVGNVIDMSGIFSGATTFNDNISSWNVGNVTNMSNMFDGATSFNQDISNWNVGNVTNMSGMFVGATSFNQDLNNWNVGNVTSMDAMFFLANSFNGNISSWNVGNVTNMSVMFNEATSFNQDISNWDVGNVTNMSNMFNGATSFNQDISNWNVGNVTSMSSMFNGAIIFNRDISNWNVGNVTSMSSMFNYATSFNQDISNWNVENVTNMSGMFIGANSFNQDLNNWNVGNVTTMDFMFYEATSFNQDLNNWNVGNVTNMTGMFRGATSFNGNISNWNIGNVTNMSNMFDGATSFNQDISNWDVSNVTDGSLNEMFKGVTFFTDMHSLVYANGTPYNYFISQRTSPNSVVISQYSIQNYNGTTGPVLALTDDERSGGNSDFNRIKDVLSISSMDELVNYSFTSAQDSTSRDILTVWDIGRESPYTVYYYNLSGEDTHQTYSIELGAWALTFTRRTLL
jgi:surface protein